MEPANLDDKLKSEAYVTTQEIAGVTTSEQDWRPIVEKHSWLINLILIAIVGSIILLSIDLYRDRTASEEAVQASYKIVDVEKEVLDYRKEVIKQQEGILANQIILNCMKNQKYWNYSICFK